MNGQTLNGTKPQGLRVLGDWQPIHIGGMPEQDTPEPAPVPVAATPAVNDAVAEAEAAAIRARSYAETEAARIKAEAEADAIRVKAAEDARRARIANDKAERKAAEEAAASEARIAELNRKRDEADRARQEAARQAAAEQQATAEQQAKVDKSARSWRRYALGFAIVCAIVALPVQMSAFYSRSAPWLLAAPLVLEGLAWVVLKGAAAAVDDHRPHWHYRLIAWGAAFLAAGVNLTHGITHFDIATAVGTAFASVAGPGVWDLHEHGRIRTRDGKVTRRERKAQERAEKRAAAERKAREAQQRAEKDAADKAAAEAAKQLAADREKRSPKVWDHALGLAAALGETTVTEAVWRRAHRDIEGADTGDTVDTIRTRRTAEHRVAAARGETPTNTPSKVTNAQRANQMPRTQRGPARKPPVRRRGDTAPYVQAAKKQAAITAKNAAQKDA